MSAVNLKKESDKQEQINKILKYNHNELLDNMKIMDGDLLVIETSFKKEEMNSYQYNKAYEGIFIYISGIYPYEEEIDILDGLKVNIIKNENGMETNLYSYLCEADVTWKDIKRDVIANFISITDGISQFEHVDKTTVEYIGNTRVFYYEDGEKILNMMKKWRYNHNSISPLDIVGIENIKVEKPAIKIGDVYEYKNIRITIENWDKDGKSQCLYRALMSLGFTESQTKELIEKHIAKLEAVRVTYDYKVEDGKCDNYIASLGEGYQPMLLGLGLSSIEKLIGSGEVNPIWINNKSRYEQEEIEAHAILKEIADNKDSEAIKKVDDDREEFELSLW